jgi:hypothetical protein
MACMACLPKQIHFGEAEMHPSVIWRYSAFLGLSHCPPPAIHKLASVPQFPIFLNTGS